jgi:Acyl-CoA carboxylase epsilon subunit
MQNEISNATPGFQAGLGEARGATGADTLPCLYVVRGEPTEAELAAVVTVLAARAAASAAGTAPARAVRSTWSDRSHLMRASISPGPGAWGRSALPR